MWKSIVNSLIFLLSTGFCHQKKLVCYWLHDQANVSSIVQGCTHVHFAFLVLDPNSLLISFEGNEEKKLNELVQVKLQKPDLKVVVALGGTVDSGDPKYGRLLKSNESRTNFVEYTVNFLNKYNLDGLDFDYQYPVCPQSKCNASLRSEREGFASILMELKSAFSSNNRELTLSVATHTFEWLIETAYDIQTMSKAVDYINLITYNNAGGWSGLTAHHSAFEWSKQRMGVWASKGMPKSKLLMGIPFYGISFKLANETNHGLSAGITASGDMLYSDICQNIKYKAWNKEMTRDGLIAYKGLDWVGYDDPTTAAEKAKWVIDNDFGGIMVWQVTHDDYTGQCCGTDKPMIKAVAHALFGIGQPPSQFSCPKVTDQAEISDTKGSLPIILISISTFTFLLITIVLCLIIYRIRLKLKISKQNERPSSYESVKSIEIYDKTNEGLYDTVGNHYEIGTEYADVQNVQDNEYLEMKAYELNLDYVKFKR